jgi:hypothetical protein
MRLSVSPVTPEAAIVNGKACVACKAGCSAHFCCVATEDAVDDTGLLESRTGQQSSRMHCRSCESAFNRNNMLAPINNFYARKYIPHYCVSRTDAQSMFT